MLARSTLADLLVRAEAGGDLGLIADVQALSLRLGEGGAESFLMQGARAPDALEALGPREGIEARLRHGFGVPLGDVEEAIASACCDELFDVAGLREIMHHNLGWPAKAGQERASLCERWLAAEPAERARMLEELHQVWAKKDGEIRSFGRGQAPAAEDYAALATATFECCHRLLQMRRTAALLREFAAALRAGQAFARAYAEAKRAQGAADFDDLIRWAEKLLLEPGMGDWVRYKLDQATDHILVDEAQDTSPRAGARIFRGRRG
jgi:ATP-dependent helicase/nuclease subunit A